MSEPVQAPESQPTPNEATSPADAPETQPQRSPSAERALRMLLDQEKQVRTQAEALKERSKAVEEAERLQRLAKEDIGAFLSEQGYTIEDITQRLQERAPNPLEPVQSEVAELRRQLEAFQAREKEQTQEKVWAEMAPEVEKFVAENEENYPWVNVAGLTSEVVGLQKAYYKEHGEYLSHDQAAKVVEDSLAPLAEKFEEYFRKKFLGASYESEEPTFSNKTLSEVSSRDGTAPELMDNAAFLRQFLPKL